MSSTSTTFSSLNRLARMRLPASADASHTSVSRDRPGRSLRPTVSELMLMFSLRNSEATRVSTPGMSSTYATNVCSMNLSLPCNCRLTANSGQPLRDECRSVGLRNRGPVTDHQQFQEADLY